LWNKPWRSSGSGKFAKAAVLRPASVLVGREASEIGLGLLSVDIGHTPPSLTASTTQLADVIRSDGS
jgi:hypothetical protein